MSGTPQRGPAAKRYSSLERIREPYLRAAHESARLTIPSLFPEPNDARQSDRERVELDSPWQELGARCVNNISSKLLLTLFPPSQPILKYKVDPKLRAEASASEEASEVILGVEQQLAQREIELTDLIEADGIRSSLHEGLRQLVNSGNVCIQKPNDNEPGIRVFRLNRYVCKRSPRGMVLELIIKESLDRKTLEPDLAEIVQEHDPRSDIDEDGKASEVDLYTHVQLLPNKKSYEVYQEIVGQEVPGTRGTSPADAPEWICLRLNKVDGEDYGRGMVEEYSGGLKSYDGLQRAILTMSANAADVKWLVDPNGQTDVRELEKAQSGGYVTGRARDVEAVRLDKNSDGAFAVQSAERLEGSLSFAFLLHSAIRRDAERVTAEEIRTLVRELDDTLGGVYTSLSQDLQLPLVKRYERIAEIKQQLPVLPKLENGDDMVRPVIVTGLEAIGRTHEQQRILEFVAYVRELASLGIPVDRWLRTSDLLTTGASNHGLQPDTIVRDKEEVEEEIRNENQQAQINELAQKAVGPAVGGLVNSQGE